MRLWVVRIVATLAVVGAAGIVWSRLARPAVIEPPVPERWTGLDRLVRELVETRLSAVRETPRSHEAWRNLAFAYHANDLVDLTAPCYEQTLALDDRDAQAWYLLGRTRSELGDVAGAVEAARRAADLGQSPGFVQWRMGFWLLELGRLDEAEAAFDHAVQLAPLDPIGRIGLARVASQRGEPVRVVELLHPLASSSTTPNLVYVRHLLGTAYQRLGDPARAEPLLARQAVPSLSWSDPWSDELYRDRRLASWIIVQANQKIGAGAPDDAIRHLQQLLPELADDPTLLKMMGKACFAAGDIGRAIQQLERVIELYPDDFPAHLNLAFAFEQTGDVDRALALLDRADTLRPGRPEVQAARARLRGGS
jgi:tetratricopeptide (TPR) repeat protein